jgi:hypothetical protein
MKSNFAVAKAEFRKEKDLFTSKLDLNLRKKLLKCYMLSTAVYGAGTGHVCGAGIGHFGE